MYLTSEAASKKLVIALLYDANEGIFNVWSFNCTVFSLAFRKPPVESRPAASFPEALPSLRGGGARIPTTRPP